MSRPLWVRVHRYAGLYLAFFLVVAGITGSVLPFAGDIDAWLNPPRALVPGSTRGMPLDPLELRERALALVPQARIDGVELAGDPAQALTVSLEPRIDPGSGLPVALPANELTLDPYTGRELSRRTVTDEGLWPVTRRNLVPLLVALHYRLALPGSLGTWLFGIAALVWTVDCLVSIYLTFPVRAWSAETTAAGDARPGAPSWWRRWRRAWRVKWNGSAHRLGFDLHRAGGLWAWLVLLLFAWSAVGLNLRTQVYEPVVGALLPMVRSPAEALPMLDTPMPDPGMGWQAARETGRRLMAERAGQQGFTVEHEAWLIYQAERGLFFYGGRTSRDLPGTRNESYVAFDARTGRFVAESQPTGIAAGNTVTQWLFALHRAQVWGLPYRVFISAMGVLCTVLAVTGVQLWHRKRQARGWSRPGDGSDTHFSIDPTGELR